jgi:hypothetical protein
MALPNGIAELFATKGLKATGGHRMGWTSGGFSTGDILQSINNFELWSVNVEGIGQPVHVNVPTKAGLNVQIEGIDTVIEPNWHTEIAPAGVAPRPNLNKTQSPPAGEKF